MLKAMELTKEEEALILKLRQTQEEEDRPVKVGFLNTDLYVFTHLGNYYRPEKWCYSDLEKKAEVDRFESYFEIACPKGTKFVCFVDGGSELWYDDIHYGIENMSREWAEKYLENIQDYKG